MTTRTLAGAYAVSSSTGALSTIRAWLQVRRERAALSQLDARSLEDMGLTHADVARETARPFWDVPARRY